MTILLGPIYIIFLSCFAFVSQLQVRPSNILNQLYSTADEQMHNPELSTLTVKNIAMNLIEKITSVFL